VPGNHSLRADLEAVGAAVRAWLPGVLEQAPSQRNVELVRAIYARFRAGDTDGALALHDPEVEVHDRPEIPDPQVYRGHDGVLSSLRVSQATFEGLDLVPEEFIDAGDQVVVVFRFRGIGRESGVPIDERLAHLWTIRRGKAVRMEVHSGREEALRAAGAERPERAAGAERPERAAREPTRQDPERTSRKAS
jgi:ketosteroid isomerase-like protein